MKNDFADLKQELKIRRNSGKTIKAYTHFNNNLLNFCRKPPAEVSAQDVRNYFEHLADKKCSGSTMRLAYSSLLFYYSQVLRRDIMKNIHIPKKEQKLTVGLTKEEVSQIIDSIENPKHRLLIELIYASGIRAQEAVRLKIKDILTDERLVIIRSGKGRKDRRTILSERVIKDFKQYLEKNSEAYLFSGRKGHLTTRSVQQIIKTAANKTRIKKKIYPHLLRHAFATHLHQEGIDVRYLQKLLGHKDQKTTEGYIQVLDDEIKKIRSPHDCLG